MVGTHGLAERQLARDRQNSGRIRARAPETIAAAPEAHSVVCRADGALAETLARQCQGGVKVHHRELARLVQLARLLCGILHEGPALLLAPHQLGCHGWVQKVRQLAAVLLREVRREERRGTLHRRLIQARQGQCAGRQVHARPARPSALPHSTRCGRVREGHRQQHAQSPPAATRAHHPHAPPPALHCSSTHLGQCSGLDRPHRGMTMRSRLMQMLHICRGSYPTGCATCAVHQSRLKSRLVRPTALVLPSPPLAWC